MTLCFYQLLPLLVELCCYKVLRGHEASPAIHAAKPRRKRKDLYSPNVFTCESSPPSPFHRSYIIPLHRSSVVDTRAAVTTPKPLPSREGDVGHGSTAPGPVTHNIGKTKGKANVLGRFLHVMSDLFTGSILMASEQRTWLYLTDGCRCQSPPVRYRAYLTRQPPITRSL